MLDDREKMENILQRSYGMSIFHKAILDLKPFSDAPSLTLRTSPALGMHVHLAKSKRDKSKMSKDPQFIAISESGTTKSFFYKVQIELLSNLSRGAYVYLQDWARLGGQIQDTVIALLAAEKEAFDTLREEVSSSELLIISLVH